MKNCNFVMAAARKSAKYTNIETNYMFQPIAVESLGPINAIFSCTIYLNVVG